MNMKKTLIPILFAALLFASCNPVKLVVDYDGEVQFAKYETYMILPWRKENSEMVNEINRQRIYDALEREMNARGYKRVDSNADLAVNVMVIIEEKTNYTAYRDYYHGGGYGYYYPFGYGYSTVRYDSYDVLQGTMIVDIFDHKQKKLIYQSAAIGEIKEKNSNREKSINKVMAKIFWDYPVKKK